MIKAAQSSDRKPFGEVVTLPTSAGFADQSVSNTYRLLRYLAAGSLMLMPLLVAAAGVLYGKPLQPSLSDYYYAMRDGGLPRTLFVTFLAFLGGILIAYRGLNSTDHSIHNLAGVFAFGVALFPMHCRVEHEACVQGLFPALHLPAAGLLFLSASWSVIYSGGDSLRQALGKLPDPAHWMRRLKEIKLVSLALMVVGMITFVAHTHLADRYPGIAWIYWIEYAGFFGFGIYWVRYMWFINDANDAGRKAQDDRVKSLGVPRLDTEPPAQWLTIP